MSIDATLWSHKFPRYGDIHTGCKWIEVTGKQPHRILTLRHRDSDTRTEIRMPIP